MSPNDAWDYCQQGVRRVNEEEAVLSKIQNRDSHFIKVYPHIFRHTYATRLVESGADLITVKELMGHSDLEMISSTYSHVSDNHKMEKSIACFKDAWYAEQEDNVDEKKIVENSSSKVVLLSDFLNKTR